MNKEVIIQFEKVLDLLIDEISNNRLKCQKFENYSSILKYIYSENNKIHRKSKQCVYPNCTKLSIKRSHSLPKKVSLTIISDNGHLLTPKVDVFGKKLEVTMSSVGINNASVFPGFCAEHENLFSVYERDGKIDTYKKVLLQTYRAICHEITVRKNRRFIACQAYKNYRKIVNSESLTYINNLLKNYKECGRIEWVKVRNADRLSMNLLKNIKALNNGILDLRDFSDLLINELKGTNKTNKIIFSVIHLDYILPVALCGFGSAAIKINGVYKNFILIMNIVPIQNETYIICATNKNNKKIFTRYLKFYCQDDLTVLNMVESFMIFGSDHWFIQPSKWNILSEQKKNILLADILQSKESFLVNYPLSIFDEERNNLIKNFLKKSENIELTKLEKAFIMQEKNKLHAHINKKIMDKDELIRDLYNRLNELSKTR